MINLNDIKEQYNKDIIQIKEKVEQEFKSAATSTNQLPGGFKKVDWVEGSTNLDWGGGAYDRGTVWLKQEFGVVNYIYDPFNRSAQHNYEALRCNPDTITCFNVLNVIKEDEVIVSILQEMGKFNTPIYITVYEKNRDSKGSATGGDKYQRNDSTNKYIELIKIALPNRKVTVNQKLITII